MWCIGDESACMRRSEGDTTDMEVVRRRLLAALHLNVTGFSALACNDRTTVLVQLNLCDDHVRGMNGKLNGGSVGLVAGNAVDVDDVLLTVDLNHTSLTTLAGTTNDLNFVVTTDRKRADL